MSWAGGLSQTSLPQLLWTLDSWTVLKENTSLGIKDPFVSPYKMNVHCVGNMNWTDIYILLIFIVNYHYGFVNKMYDNSFSYQWGST